MITIENIKSKIEDLKEQKLEFINEEESEKILLREGFYFIDKYKNIWEKYNKEDENYKISSKDIMTTFQDLNYSVKKKE